MKKERGKMEADIILLSDSIFTARNGEAHANPGAIAIRGNRIIKVGDQATVNSFKGTGTKIYELGARAVCPGFIDNHQFFTGFALKRWGPDVAGVRAENALEILKKYASGLSSERMVVGHGLSVEGWSEKEKSGQMLDREFGSRPVAVFTPDRDFCWMNRAAENKYGFSPDECYAEATWKLLRELLECDEEITAEYANYQTMLASRGVTAAKEIGFDDYSGFTQILAKLENEHKLTHRVNLVSQPVARAADFDYLTRCREKFTGEFVRCMGLNIMIDGEIDSFEGDLLAPYASKPELRCGMKVDYQAVEQTVLRADREGFRVALHAEGDAAVKRCVDIFEACVRQNGKRDSRHAIVDLEIADPDDLKRMAALDVTAINYLQIMNCYPSYGAFHPEEYFSPDKIKNVWQYRRMIDSGVNICCGTDLPLDEPDIPLSAYFAEARLFPDGSPRGGFNKEQAITTAEVLRSWTSAGQYVNFEEKRLGTLEEGMLADIAVLDCDLFALPIERLREAKVCLTLSDGRVVYDTVS